MLLFMVGISWMLPLVANECIDHCLRTNHLGILCKLDIEKAYDHVSWEFIMAILENMGFPSKWRSWILFCISTVRFSILINGEASGFFSSSRGLRQGDPLSPLLFILVMEVLSKLVNKACEVGLLEGFQIGSSISHGLLVSHLLFVNDTLIFCRPYESYLGYLRCVLLLFEAMSGLRVNLSKSSLIPIGQIPNIHHSASFFDCGVSALHSTYLVSL